MNSGFMYAACAVLIWSGFILVSRYGGVGPLLPADVIAIRYVTCSVLLFPFWFFVKRFTLFDKKLIASSLVGGLAYALCAFQGFQTAPASHAAILLPGLMPLFIALISYLSGSENFTVIKGLGIAVISTGVLMLFLQEISMNSVWHGQWWLIGAALFWSVFSVLIKRWGISPWQATVSLAFVTALVYLPIYAVFLNKNISNAFWSDVLLQAFYQGFLATIVQMLCYVQAVRRIGPSTMGALMAVVPVLAGVSATFLFDEPLTWVLVGSLFMVSLGVLLANVQRNVLTGKVYALR